MTINLIDIDDIEYYWDRQNQDGLDMQLVYHCRYVAGRGLSSYGAGDFCELHTLGVF